MLRLWCRLFGHSWQRAGYAFGSAVEFEACWRCGRYRGHR